MKKLIMVVASAGLFLLAACDNDGTDFKKDAEDFIESSTVETQAGTTFTDASCTEPSKIETGETFTCSAEGADGNTWDFDLQVTGDNSYEVTAGAARP